MVYLLSFSNILTRSHYMSSCLVSSNFILALLSHIVSSSIFMSLGINGIFFFLWFQCYWRLDILVILALEAAALKKEVIVHTKNNLNFYSQECRLLSRFSFLAILVWMVSRSNLYLSCLVN